jgi:hypothetical protein
MRSSAISMQSASRMAGRVGSLSATCSWLTVVNFSPSLLVFGCALFFQAHSTVMLSMQSDGGRSPFLFSLLFLFAALVVLLVSRRHLSRWACCRRLPSPDEADPAVEPLQAEAAGAEVKADAGAEVEAEAEAEEVPLGLAVESAGAAEQPEAPAEPDNSSAAAVVRVHLSPESEEPPPSVLPAADAAELAKVATDAGAQRQPDPQPQPADRDGTAGQEAEAESQAPPPFPLPLPSSPSAYVQPGPHAAPIEAASGQHWVAAPLVEVDPTDDADPAAAAELRHLRSPEAVASPISPGGRRRIEPIFPPDYETNRRGARLPPLRLPHTQNLRQPPQSPTV